MKTNLLDRRTLLKMAGLTALTAALGQGCMARPTATPGPARHRPMPVLVAEDRIIRTDVALRPFRPSGFVVRSVRYDAKTVIHNYGHGGAGISLSWGTAALAVAEAQQTGAQTCAVLGCGAVGRAAARLLQRHGWQVTIYARDLPPATFSNVPGGQWAPVAVCDFSKMTPEFDQQLRLASRFGLRALQDMVGSQYGVRWLDHYILKNEPIQLPWYHENVRDLLPGHVDLQPSEHPFASPYVRRTASLLVDPSIYLNAVMRDFLLAGGRIVVREFNELAEILSLAEPVIVNCTGIGAGSLFADEEIFPVKGQLVVLLPQPEIDYILGAEGMLSMMPRQDAILLGSTREPGVWDLTPNPDEIERVAAGHAKIFNAMRGT